MATKKVPGADEPSMRISAVDQVVDYLREGISNGRYGPGFRLVEGDLTETLGVSRRPVREALRQLSAEGLVEQVPNRGAVVRKLSHREAVELYQLRTALEGLAVRLAAENAGDPQRRAAFEAAIAPIWSDEVRQDISAYTGENQLFHEAVLELAGNEQLKRACFQLRFPLVLLQTFLRSGVLDSRDARHSVEDHRKIARLILDGKGDSAEGVMRRHLENATNHLDQIPKEFFRQPQR